MIIPSGFGHVVHTFTGSAVPYGAAITYGVELQGVDFGENRVEALHDAFSDNFLQQMPSAIQLERTLLKYGPNETGPQFIFSAVRPGLNAGNTEQPNVAILFRKVTSLGGRENRGRFYLPTPLEGQANTGGSIPALDIAAFQTNADAFMADLVTAEMPMVILHSSTSTPTTVSRLVVDGRTATQRRRLRR